MNIFTKALLGSTLVLGSIFGSVTPAEAKVSQCYLGNAGQQLTTTICDVDRRVNANGHVVFDISGPIEGTVVLWKDGTGEWVTPNSVSQFEVYQEGNGYVRMINTYNNYNFIFKVN